MIDTATEGRKYVLVDIDHVVANSFWRDEMIGSNTDWDQYHSSSWQDEPLEDVTAFLRSIWVDYFIVAFTARPEKWRKMTMEWFIKHNIMVDELLMRPDDAFHPSPELKLKLVTERFGDQWQSKIAFILEDRDDVTAAFKAAGVTVLQVHARSK